MLNRFFHNSKSELLSLTTKQNRKALMWLSLLMAIVIAAFLRTIFREERPDVKEKGFALLLTILASSAIFMFSPKSTTQGGLNDNISLFLQLTDAKGFTKEQQEVLKKGHCYALSVVHGAMAAVKKLEWWEAALIEIVHWDGNISSLDRQVILPDAEEPTTLRNIFIRALNYILDYQDGIKFVALDGSSPVQARNLTLKFEIADEKEIRKVKHISNAGGNFSNDKLALLLDGKEIENCICLLGNINHAISINYNYKGNAKWMVYNSNYKQVAESTIHRLFNTKEEAIDEVVSILGNSITISIADILQIHKPRVLIPVFDQLVRANPSRLIENKGLLLILELIPDYIPIICDPKHAQAKTIRLEIIRELGSIGDDKKNVFPMACYSAETIPAILNFIKDEKDAPRVIVHSLRKKTDDWTGLHYVARYAPKHIPALLDFIKSEKDAPKMVMEALTEKNNDQWTGFHVVARYAPEYLLMMLDFIKNEKDAPKIILNMLAIKNNDLWTGWHVLTRNAPKCIPAILELIKNEPNAAMEVKRLLDEENNNKESGSDFLVKYAFQHYGLVNAFVNPVAVQRLGP